MKKFTISLQKSHVMAMDEMLDHFLTLDDPDLSDAEKSAFSLLKQWQLTKLKPKIALMAFVAAGNKSGSSLRLRGGKKDEYKFTLDTPTAFAFRAFFGQFPMKPQDHLGLRILRICETIAKQYH
jgi:hypothetical protein